MELQFSSHGLLRVITGTLQLPQFQLAHQLYQDGLRDLHSHWLQCIRDISQTNVQSESLLSREIYLEPLPEMNIREESVLRAVKPLYGIPKSGLYWFETYHRHHRHNLQMTASKADLCFLFGNQDQKNQKKIITNFVILQVDDSLGNGDKSFLDAEEKEVKRFDCKNRQIWKTE